MPNTWRPCGVRDCKNEGTNAIDVRFGGWLGFLCEGCTEGYERAWGQGAKHNAQFAPEGVIVPPFDSSMG